MKKLKNLVKGGIETIIIVVLLVAVVVGLFIAVILPLIANTNNITDDTIDATAQTATDFVNGDFDNYDAYSSVRNSSVSNPD